jgi:hypothetical protein
MRCKGEPALCAVSLKCCCQRPEMGLVSPSCICVRESGYHVEMATPSLVGTLQAIGLDWIG